MERLIRKGRGDKGGRLLPDPMEESAGGSGCGGGGNSGGGGMPDLEQRHIAQERTESLSPVRRSTTSSLTLNLKSTNLDKEDDNVFLQPNDKNHPRHVSAGLLGAASLKSSASSGSGVVDQQHAR